MRIKNQIRIQIVVLLVVTCTFLWGCSFLNDYQDSGELNLTGLNAPVKVLRDEKGMAYIYAQNRDDAMMAHGFVTAQDRLFQMEVTRRFAQGRICELAGEKARALDIRMRTLGFFRHAKQQAAILDRNHDACFSATSTVSTPTSKPARTPTTSSSAWPVSRPQMDRPGFPFPGLSLELEFRSQSQDGNHRPDAGGRHGS